MQNYNKNDKQQPFSLFKSFTTSTHLVKCVCKKRFNTFSMSDRCLALSAKLKATQFYTAVCEHFTISHKWQNWTSVVKCHNSIPGVYYAIIHRARKQIPLTWFLFNYSTWKILSVLSLLWTLAIKEYLPVQEWHPHLQHLFYLNLSKCDTRHNGDPLQQNNCLNTLWQWRLIHSGEKNTACWEKKESVDKVARDSGMEGERMTTDTERDSVQFPSSNKTLHISLKDKVLS